MNVPFRHRISYRQTRNTILITLALSVVLSIVQIGRDLLNEQRATDTLVAQVVGTVKTSAALALYNYNLTMAENIMDGLFEYRPIRQARFIDDFNEVLVSRSRHEPNGPPAPILFGLIGPEKVYSFPLYYGGNRLLVGAIEVTVDRRRVARHFVARAWMALVGDIVRNGLLAVFLILLFYRSLTKPLLRMIGDVSAIDPERPGAAALRVPAGHHRDEMGLLIRALDRLLADFQASLNNRNAAERKARESEERFRALVESTSDWIWEVDPDLVFTYCSPKVRDIIGYEPEEIIGRRPFAFMPPEEGRKAREAIRRELINSAPRPFYRMESVHSHKNGGLVVIETSGVPILTEAGGLIGFRGINRDVTDRRRAEEALRRYEYIVSSSSDLMALVDAEYRHQAVNRAYLRAFGRERGDIMGKTVSEVMGMEQHEGKIAPLLDRCLKGETARCREWLDLVETGAGARFMELHFFPFFSADGAVAGIVINGRDITETRRLEQQLLQAQKMEAIGTLAGGIAHDFNNLLMGIQGSASLMRLGMDALDPRRERLDNIEQYIQQGAGLTHQLLGFARGGKGETRCLDINGIIRKSAAMFGRARKEIAISLRLANAPLMVEADPTQIEQALLNLFVNAWQAMPDGGELFIETGQDLLGAGIADPRDIPPGRYGRIVVRDTGVGIPADVRDRIFEPFFTTKGMGRGTGLGLASVYGIVKSHGGMIRVSSEQGRGTRFTLHLPLSHAPAAPAPSAAPGAIARGEGTILIVDDEAMILKVGARFLEEMGYTPITAAGGAEALAIHQRRAGEIRMVILDLIMPDMGGGEVFDRLRERDAFLPVLLSSGYSLDGKAGEVLEKGCNGFIQKPFGIEELSRKIHLILTAARGAHRPGK